MRIGIDARLWSETGVGRYVRNLVGELSKIDSKNSYVLFVMSYDEESVRQRIDAKSFTIVPTEIKWHTLEEQTKLASEINKHNLDLMHFTYFSLPLNYKKPYVLTIHDLIIHHFSTGQASTKPLPIYFLKRLAYLYLIKKAALEAQKIITVSKATKEEIKDHLGITDEKIKVIYNGVDYPVGDKKTRTLNYEYLLFVGNAYPHKNLERLLEAFQKAKKKDQKLVLVGKKDFFHKRLEKLAEKRKFEDIVFFGEASEEELPGLYQNAKAFIMPSLMEGFGLPPLEAMASSCFVLASNISSLREVCSDAAMYFDPLSIDDMAEKIKFALSSANREEYIKKGLKRVELFSWAKLAQETLKIYESSDRIRSGQ